ncbi:DNA/RNA non-specific endonuclease [Bacillus pacificus]|uniref:DNA/RNA non-specific endonuclease n=3 Tax=Bacillus TaxID=1386 RepID=UPI000789E99E|nr:MULTISPECIES: DNA/RNA non-specific endonuclease [Bacillus cereus group]KYQ00577.1 putative toxin component near putative ESAT-related protein repetitive [Bacillus cereus]MCC2351108.1 DNA/RNA non-specific endonuclease [Bacillus pacificus]MCC2468087.1 DNA/RNA non-specific endonuclease [Bacillus pacificus]MCU5248517.1 DNA/RNA non-specific endonuclease [Bacillus pacificus]MCU5362894.1 DNA/RNA non-specific endonuclease [Bacillus pacificus]
MDVKYRPEPWQNMGDGMNRITKDALIKLQRANELLKKIDGRIRDLDSDGSIHFNPKDQSQKIGELLDSYSTLQRYCGEAGRLVSEHIDKPFLVEMDKFAQKMRDTSILSFETDNRIGSTTTTVLPDAHAGYGSVPQTIKTKKDKITVEDIFRDSPAFDNVLREEYKELKKQNPDAKLNYEEYKKVVPSTRGFEYKSIEDEQKKLEMVRDIGIGLGIIITTILCPPLGTAAAVVYGAVQIKSGIDGEDWGTHRKLSQEERVGNIIFGGLDAIPVVGAVGKGVKAFKDTSELADLAKLLKFKEGMPGFNPNLGGNVVQSLRDNKAIMLDRLKLVSLKMEKSGNEKMYQLGEKIAKSIDDRTAKSASFEVDGNGLLISKQGGTDFQSWVNKHHTESNKIIDDKIKGVEASLASKGTGETPKITEIKEKDLGKHIIKGKNGRKELAPNVRYITEDGYKYTTDELGRIVDVEAGELILQKGKRNTGMQVAAGREDRLPDDDGGHLIGTQFHGSGDIDNLVAQNKQINRSGGEWYNMEKEWANALGGKPPKKVSVKIEPVYSGQSMRPNSFMVEYQIQGKKPVIREILNKAGGK